MNNEFVDYQTAVRLKAASFDEPCISHWAAEPDGKPVLVGSTAFVFNNSELKGRDVVAPFLWQAAKWLRKKKGIAINVDAHDGDFYTGEVVFLSNASDEAKIEATFSEKFSPYVKKFKSYEEAFHDILNAALDLINPEKKE